MRTIYVIKIDKRITPKMIDGQSLKLLTAATKKFK